jgi:glycosyltransferase involved in cell wall biosynthesis
VIAVGSVRASGATTLALVLAACVDDAVLVEADPDGGVLALRYGLGREPGLATLAADRLGAVADHAQPLSGGLRAVVGPESPERATQLLMVAGADLAPRLGGAQESVVADVGRLGPASPALPLARAAEVVLVAARPRADHLLAAAERVAALGPAAAVVLVGPGPYRPGEVAAQLGVRVAGAVPDDPRAAAALADGGSAARLARSALVRAVRALAADVAPVPAHPRSEVPA